MSVSDTSLASRSGSVPVLARKISLNNKSGDQRGRYNEQWAVITSTPANGSKLIAFLQLTEGCETGTSHGKGIYMSRIEGSFSLMRRSVERYT